MFHKTSARALQDDGIVGGVFVLHLVVAHVAQKDSFLVHVSGREEESCPASEIKFSPEDVAEKTLALQTNPYKPNPKSHITAPQ